MTFETYDKSDEETWPDQPIENYSNNDKDKYKYIDHDRDMTWCVNLRGIVHISDSWDPEFRTIFVTWQLRGTLDSIRNSGNFSFNRLFVSCYAWGTDDLVSWWVQNCLLFHFGFTDLVFNAKSMTEFLCNSLRSFSFKKNDPRNSGGTLRQNVNLIDI